MTRAAKITALSVGVSIALMGTAGPATAEGAPYTDPAQVGSITFCDAKGHNIDGGSLAAVPFVDKAISSVAATAPYDSPTSLAYLDAYQPREGVTPAEWSGEEIISASFFNNPAHPAVQGTRGDISMLQFVQDAPPQWDGFVQLRMFVRSSDGSFDPLHYAAADIQVSTDSWHVVSGGDVPCSAGKARSLGAILAPSAASGALNSDSNPTPGGGSGPGGSTGTPATDAPASGTPAPESTGAVTAAPVDSQRSAAPTTDDSSFPIGYVALLALVVLLSAALALTHRQQIRSWLARHRGGAL